MAPALLVVLTFLMIPVIDTIAKTFQTGTVFGPYLRLANSNLSRVVLLRTLEISVISTAFCLLIGFPVAYYIAGANRKIRGLLIVASVFPLLTGTIVRSFAWLVILGRNGILNSTLLKLGIIDAPLSLIYTQTSVVIGLVYLFTPLMILSLVGVLEELDKDVLAAAASLGAAPAAVFRQVILPLAVPGLVVGSVLVFTGSFTAYTTPQLLGGNSQMMMSTLLYQRAMIIFDWTSASAIAAVMLVLTISVVMVMNSCARRLNPTTI